MLKSAKNLILLSSLLLVACGGTTKSQANSSLNSTSTNSSVSSNNDKSSTVSSTSSSTSSSNKGTISSDNQNDEILSLKMYGGVYKGGMRTVYAVMKEGYESDVKWETSDESIVRISPREDITTECNVSAKEYGTATITAYLVNDPTIKASIQLTISEGEAMPEELFNKVKGGVKLTTEDKCYSYDIQLNETLDEHYRITTIYEETDPSNTDASNITDAYQMDVTDVQTNQDNYNIKYVRGIGNYVASEYLDIYNKVNTDRFTSDDYEDGIKWDESFYYNLWANEDLVNREMFRTFDGGKTYHSTMFYQSEIYLCASMYLLDMSPDDMYFTYENDILQLHVDVDPYNRVVTEPYTYGRKMVTTFSEIGTATIDHAVAFEHKDIHDRIDAAKETILNAKNYTVEYTMDYPAVGDDLLYRYTFTEDTIDQVVIQNNKIVAHDGAHKTGDNSYFQYEYDDEKELVTIKTQHNTPWESESIDRYPTFDFASEIFESTGENTFVTKGDLGLFISRCLYLSNAFGFYDFCNPGTLELDENGNIKTISTSLNALGENLVVTANFTNIGTTVCDIDFNNISDDNLPTSFEEASPIVYNDLVRWGLEDVVPYLYSKVNYDGVAFSRQRDENGYITDGVAYVYVETKAFESAEDRDQFIADYKELLLDLGYEDTGVDHEDTGYRLYEKDGYSIGVGIGLNWAGKETNEVKIVILNDGLVFPGY